MNLRLSVVDLPVQISVSIRDEIKQVDPPDSLWPKSNSRTMRFLRRAMRSALILASIAALTFRACSSRASRNARCSGVSSIGGRSSSSKGSMGTGIGKKVKCRALGSIKQVNCGQSSTLRVLGTCGVHINGFFSHVFPPSYRGTIRPLSPFQDILSNMKAKLSHTSVG